MMLRDLFNINVHTNTIYNDVAFVDCMTFNTCLDGFNKVINNFSISLSIPFSLDYCLRTIKTRLVGLYDRTTL